MAQLLRFVSSVQPLFNPESSGDKFHLTAGLSDAHKSVLAITLLHKCVFLC